MHRQQFGYLRVSLSFEDFGSATPRKLHQVKRYRQFVADAVGQKTGFIYIYIPPFNIYRYPKLSIFEVGDTFSKPVFLFGYLFVKFQGVFWFQTQTRSSSFGIQVAVWENELKTLFGFIRGIPVYLIKARNDVKGLVRILKICWFYWNQFSQLGVFFCKFFIILFFTCGKMTHD